MLFVNITNQMTECGLTDTQASIRSAAYGIAKTISAISSSHPSFQGNSDAAKKHTEVKTESIHYGNSTAVSQKILKWHYHVVQKFHFWVYIQKN